MTLTKKKLEYILHTLEYAMNVFSETCDCQECGPCTKGTRKLNKSWEIISKELPDA